MCRLRAATHRLRRPHNDFRFLFKIRSVAVDRSAEIVILRAETNETPNNRQTKMQSLEMVSVMTTLRVQLDKLEKELKNAKTYENRTMYQNDIRRIRAMLRTP